MMWARYDAQLAGNSMGHAAYRAACIQTALGVYMAESKTTWEPVHTLTFLGFVICSSTMTVSIDPHKYQVFCDEIETFIAGVRPISTDENGQTQPRLATYFDGHLLERLRGKCVSFLLVVPQCLLYITEQNHLIKWCYEHNNWHIPAAVLHETTVVHELRRWIDLNGVQISRKITEVILKC